MPKRRLAPLRIDELRNSREVEPRSRKERTRLRLKLTVHAPIASVKKSQCAMPGVRPTADPIILKGGALKSVK